MAMELLDIPEELFYGHIFPYLKFNDLLRLRRVCKKFKIYSDGIIRNHFPGYEIEVNETDHTLASLNRLDVPVSHIYLNNSSGAHFFEKPEIPQFLQLCASSITHLRIKLFSCCVSEKERNFFLALTNLQHLDIEIIDIPHVKGKTSRKNENSVFPGIPSTFRNLKTLKLNKMQYAEKLDVFYVQELLEFCQKLEFFRLPKINGFVTKCGVSGWVADYISRKFSESPKEPNLQVFDMQHFDERDNDPSVLGNFLAVLIQCFSFSVQLLNVNAEHLELASAMLMQLNMMDTFPVSSLLNVRSCLSLNQLKIPSLEKLVITNTSKCTFAVPSTRVVPRWTGLKCLDVTIDSEKLQHSDNMEQVPTAELLNFLFAQGEWVALKELCFRYPSNQYGRGGNLPCPRAQTLISSCKNVSSLTLTNWIGTNKTVANLWSGLSNLEEVTLEYCRMLGNVAFVGENKEAPTFMKLTKLKKFTLSGLECMPKITDLIFELVFRHLTVKQFYMKSKEPIKSVTIKGIQSLLSGEFNNSVEKFPFRGWSLDKISTEDFSRLKAQFRSSHML